MNNRITTLLTLAILYTFVQTSCHAEYPKFVSKNPKFAKIAITQDGSKVLAVAFDESKGTGTGYDTLYADTNFNDKFDKSEKIAGKVLHDGRAISVSFFMPKLSIPFNARTKAEQQSLAFAYVTFPESPSVPPLVRFSARNSIQLSRGDAHTSYFLNTDFKPAAGLAKAHVIGLGDEAKLKVTTLQRPHPNQDQGFTGIAVALMIGNWTVSTRHLPTILDIKDANGKLIHTEAGDLSKFAFG